jgi:hypothetical protein
MPSFSKMAVFPVGYFRATCQWLLRERRDVAARVAYLQAELERIGVVTVYYASHEDGGNLRVSELPIGFSVTRGSSLAKLVQAYIASGGNPYTISKFLRPDTTERLDDLETGEEIVKERSPNGGILAPQSVGYNNPLPASNPGQSDDRTGFENYEGGHIPSHRYYPGRMGSRVDRGSWDSSTIVRSMHEIRAWANPTIRARLQDMEWRIVKLSDLYEQLLQERDQTLLGAFAGQLDSFPGIDPEAQDPRLLVQSLIADMAALLMESGGGATPYTTRPATSIGHLFFALSDVPEEILGPML